MRISKYTTFLAVLALLCAGTAIVLLAERIGGQAPELSHSDGAAILAAALVSLGLLMLVICVVEQWHSIAKHRRALTSSLAHVETHGLRLPGRNEILHSAVFSLAVCILAAQFGAVVYAFLPPGFTLFSSSLESKTTIAVVMLDADGDGDLDYAAANNDNSDATKIDYYANDGTAAFAHPPAFGASNTANSLHAGDIDNDGDIDLVGLRTPLTVSTFTKYINDGSGNFSGTNFFVSGNPVYTEFALADLDQDGDLDVLGCPNSGSNLSVLKNNGSGVFTQTGSYLPACTHIVSADFDSDGKMDAAMFTASALNVYRNTGTGSFSQLVFLGGTHDYALAAGDIDGDGDIDLVASDSLSNQVTTHLNNGLGTAFVTGQTFGNVVQPRSLALGDIDNDGDLDLELGGADPFSVTNGGNTLWLN
ncbi:MAG TPA: VCBS repeat-containing protein, partial [Candidatus Peribacteria bacterium]|nr:VCBS repeat-containing protein [Candidatus Peribacteria bacterium]